MLQLLDFNENPNVGVFCRANDEIAFVQKGLRKKDKNKIGSTLDVGLVDETLWRFESPLLLARDCDFLFFSHEICHPKRPCFVDGANSHPYEACPIVSISAAD